jgi:hypothetical protein
MSRGKFVGGFCFLLVVFILGFITRTAWATEPNPEHKVTICHAHPADSVTGPWVSITVDVASVGYQQSGHQDEHDGDIIPAYSYVNSDYTVFTYPGKGDPSILEAGCKAAVSPSPTPTPSETPSTAPTEPPKSPGPPKTRHPGTPGPLALTGFSGRAAAAAGILAALGLGLLWLSREKVKEF